MMGFAGLEFTSASGKKFQCTPMARASSAVMRPKASAFSGLPVSSKGHGMRENGRAIQTHGHAALEICRDNEGQLG